MRASKIFVEKIPIIGDVPMCFFIPNPKQHHDLVRIVQNHGGRFTEMHECFTYQILPLEINYKDSSYFKGRVYKASWLVDSVKEGELLDPEEYFAFDVIKGGLEV